MSRRVRTTSGIEFARQGETSLQLDLHRPEDDAPVPCVTYFHGGGWAVGSRSDRMTERLLPLAAQGIAVASISYRLTPVATHPAQLDDAREAVRWLRLHGGELGLRTDRIGAWGASAGGWIALMLGCTTPDPQSAVQAVGAWMPVTDLLTVASQRELAHLSLPPFMAGREVPPMERGLLGLASLADDPDAVREASPVTHAAAASCPVLLVHGDADGLVNLQQSRVMFDALRAAHRDAQLLVLGAANHEDPLYESPAVLGATASFFRTALTG
jgi:acetyl esterase/lipase